MSASRRESGCQKVLDEKKVRKSAPSRVPSGIWHDAADMSRTRLALLSIVLAVAWFMVGRLWPANAPALAGKPVGVIEALAKLWPGTDTELESLFVARSRSEQDKALMAMIAAGRRTAGSAVYNFFVFDRYSAIWHTYRPAATSPTVLEIGPGYNLGQGLLFVLSGAKKYTGLDLYPSAVYDPDSYTGPHALLKLVAPGSIRVQPEQIYTVKDGRVEFNSERMEYLVPRESYDLRLPDESLDYVFSNSVFEHVSDPDRTIAAIQKVLRRGGLTANHIDFRDHEDFSKPLESLKFDGDAWRKHFNAANQSNYTNRKRLPDIVKAFERAGLRIIRMDLTKIPVSEEMRSGMHPDFRKYSLEDLGVIGALIVAEKP